MASTGTKGDGEEGFQSARPDTTDPQPSDTTSPEGGAITGTPEREIDFDFDSTFKDPNYRFFGAQPAAGDDDDTRQIYWTIDDDSLALIQAYLHANPDAGQDVSKSTILNADLLSGLDRGGVTLDVSSFRDSGEQAANFLSVNSDVHFLTIRVDWTKENKEQGSSFSPYFAVVNASNVYEDLLQYDDINAQLISKNPDGWEIETGDLDGGDGGGGGAESGPSTTAGPESGSDDESQDTDGDGGGGGLSTGAIAGIAVGGAVVLIALAVLLWFAIRRRRRSKSTGRTELSRSPNPSNHYIGGKEGADGDLNSPYSEDGANVTQHTPLDPSAPRAGATESPASFTPYQDVGGNRSNLERTGTNTSINTHSNSPVESGSRSGYPERSNTAMSTNQNVAHLVEDGMTADDIRRLEEEERQLDFEIERAGRR